MSQIQLEQALYELALENKTYSEEFTTLTDIY